MAINYKKIWNGITVVPKTTTASSLLGELETLTSNSKIHFHNGTTNSPIVTEAHAATLINKSIDATTNTITNIANTNISASAAIDATKIAAGTVDNTEFGYLDGVTSSIQTQLNSKQGTALTNTHIYVGNGSNIATDVAVSGDVTIDNTGNVQIATGAIVDADINNSAMINATKIAPGNVDNVEFGYLDGVTSNIQTQFGNKQGLLVNSAGLAAALSDETGTGLAVFNTAPTITGASIQTPSRSDIKQDTYANLVTYATTASNGQLVFAIDTKTTYQVKDGFLSSIGGGQGGINYILNSDAESGTTGWAAYADTQTVTITNASPAVFTVTATTGFYVGQPHIFTTSGGLPTGLTAGTTYYVSAVLGGTTFKVSATLGGADVNTSSAGSGTHTDRPGTPVDATGGSPVTTWTTSGTAPLRGTASFLFTKDANDRAGEGVSYAFTIDSADKGKVLQGYVDYSVSSGTYADNDVQFWIYDVTNAIIIQPAPYLLKNVTINDRMPFEFQTANNSTSYRLVMHVASASASAYTLKFDNFNVGPQAKLYGSADTDWVTFVPTGSWVTNTTYIGKWKREGDSAIFDIGWVLSGAPNATGLRFNLPPGLSVDTTKITGTDETFLSQGKASDSGNVDYAANAAYDTTTSIRIRNIGSSNNATITNTIPFTWGAADYGNIVVKVPIAGWSSSQVLSADADTRVVALIANNLSTTLTNASPIISQTILSDTHGSYNSSTGRYTAPVGGYYAIVFNSNQLVSGGPINVFAYVSGSPYGGSLNAALMCTLTSSGSPLSCSILVKVNANDIIDVRPGASGTLNGTGGSFSINRLTGPAQIAASESVNARYFSSSTAISGTLATITFATKDFDSHNAYSAGVFTVPSAGKYQVNVALLITGTIALNNNLIVEIQKNGAVISRFTEFFPATLTDGKAAFSDEISCIATDTIRIQASSTATGPSIVSSNFDNYLSIFRSGN